VATWPLTDSSFRAVAPVSDVPGARESILTLTDYETKPVPEAQPKITFKNK